MRSRKAGLPLASRARTESFIIQNFFSYSGNQFSPRFMLPGPVHCVPKIYFGFSKSAPTPRYTILDSRLPPCHAISEGRPPLSNTSSEAGALPLVVCIENDSDQKFSVNIFSWFFWKPILSMFHATLFIVSRNYLFGFWKSAPTPR